MRYWLIAGFLLFGNTLVWATPEQAGLPGYCAIGGEEITVTDPATGRQKPSPDYREIQCQYTNGQHARVALCSHHFATFTSADYPTIWESIKRGWESQMGTWPRARRDKYWAFYKEVAIQSCGGD